MCPTHPLLPRSLRGILTLPGPNTKQGISTVPAASAQMRPKFQTLTYQNGGGKERANGSYIMSTSKGGYSAIQGYCWLQQTLGAGSPYWPNT